MEEIKYFTIKRALLLSLVIVSGLGTIIWIATPELFITKDPNSSYNFYQWPHNIFTEVILGNALSSLGIRQSNISRSRDRPTIYNRAVINIKVEINSCRNHHTSNGAQTRKNNIPFI